VVYYVAPVVAVVLLGFSIFMYRRRKAAQADMYAKAGKNTYDFVSSTNSASKTKRDFLASEVLQHKSGSGPNARPDFVIASDVGVAWTDDDDAQEFSTVPPPSLPMDLGEKEPEQLWDVISCTVEYNAENGPAGSQQLEQPSSSSTRKEEVDSMSRAKNLHQSNSLTKLVNKIGLRLGEQPNEGENEDKDWVSSSIYVHDQPVPVEEAPQELPSPKEARASAMISVDLPKTTALEASSTTISVSHAPALPKSRQIPLVKAKTGSQGAKTLAENPSLQD
jgi:hypothetical protein